MGLFWRKKPPAPEAPAPKATPRPIASPQKPTPLTDEAAREIARQLSQYMKQKY